MVKLPVLLAVPFELITEITPEVPLPTTAVICVAVFEVMEETGVPPIVTEVAPDKLVPLIVIEEPAQPLAVPKLVIAGAVET